MLNQCQNPGKFKSRKALIGCVKLTDKNFRSSWPHLSESDVTTSLILSRSFGKDFSYKLNFKVWRELFRCSS